MLQAQSLPASCEVPAPLRDTFPSHPAARDYQALGIQFSKQHELACAVAAFQKAAELQPGSRKALHELAEAQNDLGMLQGGVGDAQQAEKTLLEASQSDPAYPAPHVNLAMLLAGEGRFREASLQAEEAVRVSPGNAQALTTLAMIRTRLGQTAGAIAIFRKVVSIHPDSAEAHVNLGIALADNSDPAAALDEFTKAVNLAPKTAKPHLNRGRLLADLKRFPEAEAELETARKIEPDSAPILYRLALTERQLGHYGRSAELLQKVVAIDPQNTEAHALLGQDLARLQKSSDAVAQWKRVLEKDPDNTQALYGLIRALPASQSEEVKVYQQRFAAIQERNRVLDRVETLSNFAIAAADANDFSKAIEQLQEAVKVCGECRVLPLLHKNLGLIYLRSGNLADGEREIRTSLSLDPKDAEAQSTLARLEGMRDGHQNKP